MPKHQTDAAADPLPVHFFTIVLNGEPYVRHHVHQMARLPFCWHWHVVEGVAELRHDTAWSVAAGGHVPRHAHRDGHSVDGTSGYLDGLAAAHPGRVHVYRKPPGQTWDGKREMVSAPLASIEEDCLLWEIDVDELWTAEQFEAGRRLFLDDPAKTAAFYWCWPFVGPDRVISTRHCYANNPQGEWLRTWRYRPGMRWLAHEPPILGEPTPDGRWRAVQSVNPLTHDATEAAGLVFQHYAYATEAQARFKQDYYGYAGAVDAWRRLQTATDFPVYLRDYFPWVRDDTQVDRSEHFVERRLIDLPQPPPDQLRAGFPPDAPHPRVIVDGVFFQLYRTGIARVWQQILKQWAADGFTKHVLVLDRAGTMPRIDGVHSLVVPPHSYDDPQADRRMLQRVCDEQQASAFISTYCTTPLTTPAAFMAHDMIPELFGWDLSHPMWREKHDAIRYASAIACVSEATRRDLLSFFPALPPARVTVTPLGVADELRPRPQDEVEALRRATGVTRPYFLLVGARGGYKNTILTFRALAQLTPAELDAVDILCAGHAALEDDYARLLPGKEIKAFLLSDDQLAAAYTGAVALLHPSAYEGFGLPVLEAMACGCPVITTAAGSLAEVAGDAALIVGPEDVDAMAQALRDVQQPDTRARLTAAGLAQAKKFSWPRTAEAVKNVLFEVARASRP